MAGNLLVLESAFLLVHTGQLEQALLLLDHLEPLGSHLDALLPVELRVAISVVDLASQGAFTVQFVLKHLLLKLHQSCLT